MNDIRRELRRHADPKRAAVSKGFFKTGKGEYDEGDVFIGVTVPDSRKVAKKYVNISLDDLRDLIQSKIHEERLVGFLVLVEKYKNGERESAYRFYLENMRYANNWDLVDLTADKIVGDFLLDKNKSILYKLAKSDNLWERRVSIVSTFNFIKNNKFDDTLEIARILLNDRHDLIHKAVGWMLREVGKRNLKAEETFLKKHYGIMPRTMLRYAVEKFDDEKRKFYMGPIIEYI